MIPGKLRQETSGNMLSGACSGPYFFATSDNIPLDGENNWNRVSNQIISKELRLSNPNLEVAPLSDYYNGRLVATNGFLTPLVSGSGTPQSGFLAITAFYCLAAPDVSGDSLSQERRLLPAKAQQQGHQNGGNRAPGKSPQLYL